MNKGHMLNDRYKIDKKIGGGGMANVFLARDTILDRDVAVKALRMEYANDQEFIARFDREAQSASSLSHPNIVNIFDVGGEDHVMYIVMEYVDGMTLKEYIQLHGSIEVSEALDIMRQLTSAIAHAHDNDIVHRDIKPQNILIDKFGQIKVTDFGIAVALSATSLTHTNSILGSVHYLSPEQARGGLATKKSDIYSIGIVLFELLTGKIPFSGQSPVSIALKHLQSNTPSVRRFNQDIPQSVENIVLKATAKDPFHRYQSIYEMEEALATALDPDKLNEEMYEPPVEAGDETKAIPIITDHQIANNPEQHTIVHQTNGATKNYPEESNAKESFSKAKKKEKKPKKGKKRKKWPMILIIIVVLLAAGVASFLILPDLLQPKDIVVENVIGKESDEAREILEEKKFVVEDELVYSEDVEEGHVVKTNPGADRIAKEGSTVTLFISQGKEKVNFHDYVGRDFSQVKRILDEAGYSEVIKIDKYSNRPEGEIIDQIQPTPESDVIPSETKVIFEVSMGPELISLNNLTGMTQEEAEAYLNSKNLKMNVIETNSETVPAGMVIRQSPTMGMEVEEGTTVDVYISIGPVEKPHASHTITYTVPYKPMPPENPEEVEQDNPEETPQEQVEPVEQNVKIYIGDANNDITNVYREVSITEDTPVTFTLSIAPGSEAEYVITRDDEEIVRDTVLYEDGE
ncbi:Stk1 family PASTA domain-containing Ser/Thr kinase [Oceanobacillus chungangensis]|uniref:Serine/threonine-protein kinase PrkC n=1 Tax=Oceanobacillus chungangensis TaxID=1229152 RepID=A0A3D8PPK3_9BACI|nr:Stk1 family PASTA domain-containing Ser/Thr kinase [Oceanobacillus chungangensis]RDW17884.1 serine/threonine protein kinase [Oceanobacillus chungangensis]